MKFLRRRSPTEKIERALARLLEPHLPYPNDSLRVVNWCINFGGGEPARITVELVDDTKFGRTAS